jgi:hypothetical protein
VLVFADGIDPAVRAAVQASDARAAVFDPRGRTVRCVPTRRTVMQQLCLADGSTCVLFRKVRYGAVAAAEQEWRTLAALAHAGFAVSRPAYFARAGEDTVVATFAVAGRPLLELFRASGVQAARTYALEVALPIVRRLHTHGWVFRDLYWQHWLAPALEVGTGGTCEEPTWIDVERVLHPLLRWRRWVVKDLAGLVATWPFEADEFAPMLIDAYRTRSDAHLLAAVLAKARRIRERRPKFGA